LHIASSSQRERHKRHKRVLVQRYLEVIRLSGVERNSDKRGRPGQGELDFITIDSYRHNLGGRSVETRDGWEGLYQTRHGHMAREKANG